MDYSAVRFTRHAFERMFERSVTPEAVIHYKGGGDNRVVSGRSAVPKRAYPGFERAEPLHLVVARDPASETCFVVTVYRPDPALWSEDFKKRRS